jgi:hypothetical protein
MLKRFNDPHHDREYTEAVKTARVGFPPRSKETRLPALPRSPGGRVTVLALQLNNIYAVTVRQAWISAGWHPPEDGF